MARRIFITLVLLLSALLSAFAGDAPKERHFEKRTVIHKGETTIGGSILYAGLNSDNSEYFQIVNSLVGSGKLFRVAPSFYTAYRDNAAIGCRICYSNADILLDNTRLSLLSEDLSLTVSDLSAGLKSVSAGIFHRNYIGLDSRGTVGLFCEFQLSYAYSRIATKSADTYNDSQGVKLTFAPGIVLFILPMVSVEASIGIANLGYNWSRAVTDGQSHGTLSRATTALKLNILDCNFGIAYHF